MAEATDNKDINKEKPEEKQDKEETSKEDKTVPYSRFKEVNDQLGELKTWKEEQTKAQKEQEEKELKDQDKFKELADKRKAELDEATNQLQTLQKRNAIVQAAFVKKVNDPDDVWNLIDKSNLKLDDDGKVTNADELVDKLLEKKPYLTSDSSSASSVGAGSNPSGSDDKTYSLSWVREHWKDLSFVNSEHKDLGGLTGEQFLEKLEKEGRIDYNA